MFSGVKFRPVWFATFERNWVTSSYEVSNIVQRVMCSIQNVRFICLINVKKLNSLNMVLEAKSHV